MTDKYLTWLGKFTIWFVLMAAADYFNFIIKVQQFLLWLFGGN